MWEIRWAAVTGRGVGITEAGVTMVGSFTIDEGRAVAGVRRHNGQAGAEESPTPPPHACPDADTQPVTHQGCAARGKGPTLPGPFDEAEPPATRPQCAGAGREWSGRAGRGRSHRTGAGPAPAPLASFSHSYLPPALHLSTLHRSLTATLAEHV